MLRRLNNSLISLMAFFSADYFAGGKVLTAAATTTRLSRPLRFV